MRESEASNGNAMEDVKMREEWVLGKLALWSEIWWWATVDSRNWSKAERKWGGNRMLGKSWMDGNFATTSINYRRCKEGIGTLLVFLSLGIEVCFCSLFFSLELQGMDAPQE